MGTFARGNSFPDALSVITNDNYDSHQSSSTTTYNPTYFSQQPRQEPNLSIFDDLERRRAMGRQPLPIRQMNNISGTLNSFPPHQIDDRFGITNSFSDSYDLNEIELVTDMVEDMTRDDDIDDTFIEALNPNIENMQSGINSPGWFSVSNKKNFFLLHRFALVFS